MLTIGLIGGIASGKSAVARELVRLGAVVLDADRAGHAVLKEPEVIDQLVTRWGLEILSADGQINRSAVAKIVFAPSGEAERLFLNQLTHPRIATRLRAELDTLEQANQSVVVLDAALLLEADWARLCDRVLFVDAPQTARAERAKLRGWDSAELARREATQLPLAVKREQASNIIQNDGSLEDLRRQVQALWDEWGTAGNVKNPRTPLGL
ncbi:dephospho-CoA kinase [Anatilimnocola sp. NA78]|uniref:dephospho-CoA kinase n=1 Tax=Anatilimnocola sp. NA78 TaxID=3415683 RepID=UPI003CE4793E